MPRNKLHLCFHVVQCLLLTLTASQHPNATFLYPTGNETFNILDTINVQWESNFDTSILYTWVYDPLAVDAFQGMSPPLQSLHLQIPLTKIPVSPPLTVPQSGYLSYNLSQYESRFSKFPADVWFELIYDPSIPGRNGGVNGPSFTATNNASASPVIYPTPSGTSSSNPTSNATVNPTANPTPNNKGTKAATGLAGIDPCAALRSALARCLKKKDA
jgi:hypothetical protein